MPFTFPRRINNKYATTAKVAKLLTLGVSSKVAGLAPKQMRRYKAIEVVGDFVLQQRQWGSQRRPTFRIATTTSPAYIVAQGNDIVAIRNREWKYIVEDFADAVPEGLKKSRKKKAIVEWYDKRRRGGNAGTRVGGGGRGARRGGRGVWAWCVRAWCAGVVCVG
jgi:hypothetical protein